jgi:hypothetical protein
MRCSVAVMITVLLLCAVGPDASTQAQAAHDDGHSFLRDPNRPFVYLKFDHFGTGCGAVRANRLREFGCVSLTTAIPRFNSEPTVRQREA